MYVKTPRRYSGRGRKHNLISCRRIAIWVMVPVLLFLFIGIYENRQLFIPQISDAMETVVGDAGERLNEINAPAPTPTRDPTNDLQRAEDSWRRGSIEDAVNIYSRAIDSVPNDLNVHYRYTLGLIMQGKLNDAVEAAENAVTADPFSADAWAIRSMALNRVGRNGEAIASAQRALEIATRAAAETDEALAMSRARAQAFLAEAYLNVGQGERARTTVDLALESYPDSFEAYQIRGRVQQEVIFDPAAALNDYRTAYEIAPNMIYLAIWVARMEQNSQTAVDIYQDIIDQNPTNAQVLFALGDYYLRVEGNPTEAASYMNRCVEAVPDNAECHYLLGRAYFADEQFLSAQESLQMAIDLNATARNGAYYWWYANTSRALGQCPQALIYLQNGYQIAQEANNTSLMGDFDFLFGECGRPGVSPATEPETEPETEDEFSGGNGDA